MSRLWIIFILQSSGFECAAEVGAIHLRLRIKRGGQPQCFQLNCCHQRAMIAYSAPYLLQIYWQMSACGCHYTSSRGEDDVALKLSIKYSSGGSQTSFFPPVNYRARRLERSFLRSKAANEVSCMRSHEFPWTVFNDWYWCMVISWLDHMTQFPQESIKMYRMPAYVSDFFSLAGSFPTPVVL